MGSTLKVLIIILSLFNFTNLYATVPITTDNRIKTFVYNENEVYLVVINYGFQTSIEFSKGEEVETISVGDTYSWKITPIGSRLFIKPMEENVTTNMTVITNKRTYQFDIASKMIDPDDVDMELAYVVKFYYPDMMVNKKAGVNFQQMPKYNNRMNHNQSSSSKVKSKNYNYSID